MKWFRKFREARAKKREEREAAEYKKMLAPTELGRTLRRLDMQDALRMVPVASVGSVGQAPMNWSEQDLKEIRAMQLNRLYRLKPMPARPGQFGYDPEGLRE